MEQHEAEKAQRMQLHLNVIDKISPRDLVILRYQCFNLGLPDDFRLFLACCFDNTRLVHLH